MPCREAVEASTGAKLNPMPPEDQATRSAARCGVHLSSASVALCDACGRPLCVRCAVPVRGQVIGPECMAQVLGPDGAPAPQAVPARRPDVPFLLLGLALVGAIVGSILPWTRFGDPSGIFGGWGLNPQRWSSVATYSALLAFALWVWVGLRRRDPSRVTAGLLLVAACAIVAGALLHVLNPPPFTHAWLGPWVTLGFGILAVATSAACLVRSIRPNGPNR